MKILRKILAPFVGDHRLLCGSLGGLLASALAVRTPGFTPLAQLIFPAGVVAGFFWSLGPRRRAHTR